jgi:hypothetical protein
MAVWLSGSLMKYCLGGRVDTANRVRGSRLSITNSSIVTAGPQQLPHTSNGQLLTASSPTTAEGLYMSFGNNIILFTSGSYQAQQLF